MYCRASDAWGRFWRRNKETSSSQRLCQQQEAASLQRPTGLESSCSLPCEALSRVQLSFLFLSLPQASTSTVAEPISINFGSDSRQPLLFSLLFFSSSHLALPTIRTIRAFGSDCQQLAGAAGLLVAGTCIALLSIRRPPFLSPTVTNAFPTYLFSSACSGTIEATQLELWR